MLGAPEGPDVTGVPGLPLRLQLAHFFGQRGREVARLADISGKVVQLQRARRLVARARERVDVPVVTHQLEVAGADGHLLAEPPVKRLVRRAFLVAGEKREEIHAFEAVYRRGIDSRGGERSRGEIELDHRRFVDPGPQPAGPRDEKGHADTALECRALGAAQGGVDGGIDRDAGHGGATVVADETNQGFSLLTGLAQTPQHEADVVVHRGHHGRIRAALGVADGGESCEAVLRRIHRSVDGVEGQVQEPRPLAVTLDERRRLATEGIREVRVLFDGLGAAENASRVEVAVRSAEEPEELVEAAALGLEVGAGAEVPLAHERGRVTGGLQAVGDRRFRRRQALAGAAGIELVAEPRLVPARQQPGPRGRAVRTGDVAVGEAHARSREGVEVRCQDVTAAVETDIGVAHVVADDEQDVGPGGDRGDKRAGGEECGRGGAKERGCSHGESERVRVNAGADVGSTPKDSGFPINRTTTQQTEETSAESSRLMLP